MGEKLNEFRMLYDWRTNNILKEKHIVSPLRNFFQLTKVLIFNIFDKIGFGSDEILEDIMKHYDDATFLGLGINPQFYNQNLVIYNNNSIMDAHPN
ncbi:MAG: hypothetical protein QXR71_03180 [Candidatus Aenigmatarchaeota archaeon]